MTAAMYTRYSPGEDRETTTTSNQVAFHRCPETRTRTGRYAPSSGRESVSRESKDL